MAIVRKFINPKYSFAVLVYKHNGELQDALISNVDADAVAMAKKAAAQFQVAKYKAYQTELPRVEIQQGTMPESGNN